ncbi:MAG: MqnA/MqnD/SBP family protein [Thermoproteus sp.]
MIVVRLKYAHNDPLFYKARLSVVSASNLEAARLLAEGKADVGFVPVTMAAELGLPIVPRLAVYSTGPVISARIFRGRGAGRYAAVGDTTVNARAAAVLLGVKFEKVEDPWRALDEYEGVLVIGDDALKMADRGLDYIADIGELWQERIGTPLIYAVLATRTGLPKVLAEDVAGELENSLAAFYEDPAPLVKRTAKRLGVGESIISNYFARVKYLVNDATLRGLEKEAELLGLREPKFIS